MTVGAVILVFWYVRFGKDSVSTTSKPSCTKTHTWDNFLDLLRIIVPRVSNFVSPTKHMGGWLWRRQDFTGRILHRAAQRRYRSNCVKVRAGRDDNTVAIDAWSTGVE